MVIMMVVNSHDHFDDDDMRMDVQIEIYDGKPPTAKALKAAASGWCTNGLVAKGVQWTIVRGRWGNLKIMCEIGSSGGGSSLSPSSLSDDENVKGMSMPKMTTRMMGYYNGT